MTLHHTMDKAFTTNEMATIRSETKEAMKMLEAKPTTPKSWILGGTTVVGSDGHDNRSDRCRCFDTNGFLKVDQFAGMYCSVFTSQNLGNYQLVSLELWNVKRDFCQK